MRLLLRKELSQLRAYFALVVGIYVALIALAVGLRDVKPVQPVVLMWLDLGPFLAGLGLPQIIFAYEERANSLRFLRALPVHPRWVVAAKYLALVIAVVILPASIVVFKLFGMPWRLTMADVLTGMVTAGMGLLVGAVNMLLHFWLGAKKAKMALLVFLALANVAGVLAMALFSGGASQWARDLATFLTVPVFRIGLFSFAAAAMLISYAGAAAIFTRRDISGMP